MKDLLVCLILMISTALVGCGTVAKEIRAKAQSEKSAIFVEANDRSALPEGQAGLVIKANIKTHVEDYYILESKESLHGKQGYPFVFNIDGQGVEWKVDGVKDVKPAYNPDGTTSRDPEAGDGLKYFLEKRLRLAAGTHRVYFGLPEDKYATEFEIALKEGEVSTLEFKPIYRTKRLPTRIPTFLKGIDKYEVFLDDKQII